MEDAVKTLRLDPNVDVWWLGSHPHLLGLRAVFTIYSAFPVDPSGLQRRQNQPLVIDTPPSNATSNKRHGLTGVKPALFPSR